MWVYFIRVYFILVCVDRKAQAQYPRAQTTSLLHKDPHPCCSQQTCLQPTTFAYLLVSLLPSPSHLPRPPITPHPVAPPRPFSLSPTYMPTYVHCQRHHCLHTIHNLHVSSNKLLLPLAGSHITSPLLHKDD